ncbi:uncharacterized protein V6R79_008804 [Siganus canaliculatus]
MRTCSASSAALIWRCATEPVHATGYTHSTAALPGPSSSPPPSRICRLTLFLLTAIFSSWNFFFLEMSLSDKSDEELSELLVQYGIKHGPVVDSTRKLYEKKLESAMQEAAAKPSSDKTYYREEEEEIIITYQSPMRHEGYGDIHKRRSNIEQEDEYEESDQESEPLVQPAERAANHSSVRSREPVRSSGGCLWKLTRLLLCGALAAALYYAYCHVINSEDTSFKIQ